jgi:hypothetical protein
MLKIITESDQYTPLMGYEIESNFRMVNAQKLVGALPEVSDSLQGFQFRLAALTWFQFEGDSADPWDLMRYVVPELLRLTRSKTVRVEYCVTVTGAYPGNWEKAPIRVENWDTLMLHDMAYLHHDVEFPHRIIFSNEVGIDLGIIAGFWNAIGGPEPYHDSVALYFYSEVLSTDTIRGVLQNAANELGIAK